MIQLSHWSVGRLAGSVRLFAVGDQVLSEMGDESIYPHAHRTDRAASGRATGKTYTWRWAGDRIY